MNYSDSAVFLGQNVLWSDEGHHASFSNHAGGFALNPLSLRVFNWKRGFVWFSLQGNDFHFIKKSYLIDFLNAQIIEEHGCL